MIDFGEVTKIIGDDELMDDQMFEIYAKAFNQLEKLEKRASV